jgi:hypothetical protein
MNSIVDWNSAPEWANYRATDKSGATYWFCDLPEINGNSEWVCNGKDWDCQFIGRFPINGWRESLVKRHRKHWANYKAIGPNGWVYYFEKKPVADFTGWNTDGRMELASRVDWKNSLEEI